MTCSTFGKIDAMVLRAFVEEVTSFKPIDHSTLPCHCTSDDLIQNLV